MLLLAADYVGNRVLEILISRRAPLRCIVLHRRDPGHFNARLAELHARHLASSGVTLLLDDALDELTLEAMAADRLELGFLGWWPEIVKGRLLALPRRGWINLHPGFLPFNRGKHPNFWCLAEGTPCGVALHYATSKVDAGDVIARAQLAVTWEDTGETVYRRSLDLIVQLFEANIDSILIDRIGRTPQAPDQGSFHSGAEIDEASRIDLDRSYRARDLLNLIRARMFRPHPTAYFEEAGKKYTVEVVIRRAEGGKNG